MPSHAPYTSATSASNKPRGDENETRRKEGGSSEGSKPGGPCAGSPPERFRSLVCACVITDGAAKICKTATNCLRHHRKGTLFDRRERQMWFKKPSTRRKHTIIGYHFRGQNCVPVGSQSGGSTTNERRASRSTGPRQRRDKRNRTKKTKKRASKTITILNITRANTYANLPTVLWRVAAVNPPS